jgi:hypothetical protein
LADIRSVNWLCIDVADILPANQVMQDGWRMATE